MIVSFFTVKAATTPAVATAVPQPAQATPMPQAGVVAHCPPGAPPGGTYTTESYIGMSTLITILILAIIFWPALFGPLCCPCDQRQVYIVNGQKFDTAGRMILPGACGCNC
mmetsp:Transcript_10505/g.22338  ORF Transcript_10505/g.22338 Transcript_10505/m.22338 type:complete len:111 (+) Transcript_10505:663-995(+)|eukprot:6077567-Pleurochrysis_carterae.AAC.5